MAMVRLTGHVDENGLIELTEHVDLPPGDVTITIETIRPEDEAAADARWDVSFAQSQDLLSAIAAKVRKNRDQGLNLELDPDML